MSRFSLNSMNQMQRISEYVSGEKNEFHTEKLITDLGLYSALLLDTNQIEIAEWYNGKKIPHFEVSNDVKALHELIYSEKPILLPCPECRERRPFVPVSKTDMEHNIPIYTVHRHINVFDANPVVEGAMSSQSYTPSIPNPQYCFGESFLAYYNKASFSGESGREAYNNICANQCIEGILNAVPRIHKRYQCTLNCDHEVIVEFIVYKAVEQENEPTELITKRKEYEATGSEGVKKEYEKAQEQFNTLQYSLIIEKIGQYPSTADMQLFDIEKYKPILSKERFKDFKRALGLYSNGIGCGSFLYLRRIYEDLIEETHQKLKAEEKNWDEEKYESHTVNEKIDYIESFGEALIPEEIKNVKDKIYGVLSKGIHESSDETCLDLFVCMKYAIETVLDQKLAKKTKIEKANAFCRTMHEQTK